MPRGGERARPAQRRLGIQGYPDAGGYGLREFEAGSEVEEIIERFHVTREQIRAVLEFAARSLEAPPVPVGSASTDAHPL